MTKPEDKQQTNFEHKLKELETSLQLLKKRYTQVERDQQQKAQWQQKIKNIKENKNQTPEINAELKRIIKELQTLEINLESGLFSWKSLNRPFWQAIRFGGLGIIIGWVLKSLIG